MMPAVPTLHQNGSQGLYFEHLGALAPDMGRSTLRGLILSIWVAWRQIWDSEGLFGASGRPGPAFKRKCCTLWAFKGKCPTLW